MTDSSESRYDEDLPDEAGETVEDPVAEIEIRTSSPQRPGAHYADGRERLRGGY